MYGHEDATAALLDLLWAADEVDLNGLVIMRFDGSIGVQWPEAWAGRPCATPIHAQDLGLVLQCLSDAGCRWRYVYAARWEQCKVPDAWIEREYGSPLREAEAVMLREAEHFDAPAWSWDGLMGAVKAAVEGWTWSNFQSVNGHHLHGLLGDEIGMNIDLRANGRLSASLYCEVCEDEDYCCSVRLHAWMAEHDCGLLTPRNVAELVAWVQGEATEAAAAHLGSAEHRHEMEVGK